MNQLKNVYKCLLFVLITLVFPTIVDAQTKSISITGKVIDNSNQQAIAGVSVVVKGTSVGSTTDEEGKFSLNCKVGDKFDVILLGYDKITETGKEGITNYNFSLTPNTKQLSDVVITALGIKKDKKVIGYSTQEVSGSDLVKAREPNAMNSLVGKVAGLNVGVSA